jgi:PAS domain S-box-containing protein
MASVSRSYPPILLLVGGFVALVIVLSLATTMRSLVQLDDEASQVAHTHELIGDIQKAQGLVSDAETTSRSYIFSGDRRFLSSFEKTANGLKGQLSHLKELSNDNATQQKYFLELNRLCDERTGQIEKVLGAYDREGFEAAKTQINNNIKLDTQASINGVIGAMILEEQRLLADRAGQTRATRNSALMTSIFVAMVALAAIGSFFYIINKHLVDRQLAVKEISERGDRLRATLASIGDAVIVTDEMGTVTNMNSVAERLTGSDHGEAIGQPLDQLFSIVNEFSRLPIDNPAKRALAEATVVRQADHVLFVAKHGGQCPIDISASPIRTREGEVQGCVLVFRDLSERRLQEVELRNKSEQLRLTAAVGGLGAIVIDYVHGMATLDATAAKIFGFDRLSLPREELHGRIHPEDLGRVLDTVNAALKAKDSSAISLEHRICPPDGDIRWVSVRMKILFDDILGEATPVCATVAVLDVTETIRNQQETAARAKFQSIAIELLEKLGQIDDEDEIRRLAASAVGEHLGADRAGFAEVVDDAAVTVSECWSNGRLAVIAGPFGTSIVGDEFFDRLRGGETMVVNNAQAEPLTKDSEYFSSSKILASISVPIMRQGEWRASMFLHQATPRDWDSEEVGFVKKIALLTWDVIERARVRRSLQEGEQFLRDVLDNLFAFVGVIAVDGTLVQINRAPLDAAGIVKDAVIGKPFWETHWWSFSPEAQQFVRDSIARASAGDIVRQDVQVRMRGDELEWIDYQIAPLRDLQGRITHLIPSGMSLKERKKAEVALRDSEQRARALADNMSQHAWMGNELGAIVWFNRRWHDYTGLSAADSRDAGWISAIHPADRDEIRNSLRHSFVTGEPWEQTFQLRGKAGEYRWFLSRALPLRDDDGRITRWFGSNTDITEQKSYETSLREARDAAEAASRSRGAFLANMSHEIRTPMTAIMGHLDILADHVSDPDNLQSIDIIRRNGKFLLQLINDILDLSKIDAGKLSIDRDKVRPDLVLAELRSLMDLRAKEKRLRLEFGFDGKLPQFIKTDATRLRQVLLNLVGNAIKFTEQGNVRVVARYDHDKKLMVFEIADTGVGIAPDNIGMLFQPFTQVDSSDTRVFGGTGLGLAISRRLAQLLGGDISVSSQLNKGSTFVLQIDCGEVNNVPLIEPSLTVVDAPDSLQQNLADDKIDGCILIVDDRRDIRFVAQHFIEKAGGRVMTAINGRQALDVLADDQPEAPNIDLVLMDMQMPVMDGYQTVSALRSRGFNKPIIALTANAMRADRERCIVAGCTDYLSKPLDGPLLVRTIVQYLHQVPS